MALTIQGREKRRGRRERDEEEKIIPDEKTKTLHNSTSFGILEKQFPLFIFFYI
jgi:hypothetical protein